MDKRAYILVSDRVRANAMQAVDAAPSGYVVTVAEPTRTSEQNAMLHALLSDMAKSSHTFAGKRRSLEEWKMLVVSGHAVATKRAGEVIPGIEGEFVAIRESTATMSVSRASSLIEYVLAYCISNGIPLNLTQRGGFPITREPEAA